MKQATKNLQQQVTWIQIPLPQDNPPPLSENHQILLKLAPVVTILNSKSEDRRGNVFVHCIDGIVRSGAVFLLILKLLGWTIEDSLEVLREALGFGENTEQTRTRIGELYLGWLLNF